MPIPDSIWLQLPLVALILSVAIPSFTFLVRWLQKLNDGVIADLRTRLDTQDSEESKALVEIKNTLVALVADAREQRQQQAQDRAEAARRDAEMLAAVKELATELRLNRAPRGGD